MKYSDYKFLNEFYTDRCKKIEDGKKRSKLDFDSVNDMGIEIKIKFHFDFFGPEDYFWENDTDCCFFVNSDYGHRGDMYVLPRDWLRKYDPTVPIFFRHVCYYPCYLDLEKLTCTSLETYLIRDRFRTTDCEDEISYSIGKKSDQDWCITHLNLNPFYASNFYELDFSSFLLTKNIDFSKLDAKVEAGDLKCPVRCYKSIKIKDNPQNGFGAYTLLNIGINCFCVICRKDYRAIEVSIYLVRGWVTLYLIDSVK